MAAKEEIDLTRRLLLAASAGVLLPRLAWTQTGDSPVVWWKLEDQGDTARDSVGGAQDAVASRTGHAPWVGAGRDRALRLDGYSVWIQHSASLAIRGGEITLSAWLALESYPVDVAPVLELDGPGGIRWTIDTWGFVEFSSGSGESAIRCKSPEPLPRGEWVHIAASSGRDGIALYRDGAPWARAASSTPPFEIAAVWVGRSGDSAIIADVFPTGVLNGLIKDVRVYAKALSAGSIRDAMREAKPAAPPNLEINGPWCDDDPQRPIYHAIPPRSWTNEPHGLIHWGGMYHLFYQKNANGPYWGRINWGHLTSPDLRAWTEMPVALSPEPGVDSEGCWSGSVLDFDGKLALIYTAGDGHRATICLATSSDGVRFTRHPGNPIIARPPEGGDYPEFRDPHVWREGDTYYLLIGSAVRHVGGTALLYRSSNLVDWEFRKPLLVGDRETSGVFWEMPIFVRVGDRHALIVCEVPGRASYWVGTWKDETFTPIDAAPRRLELFNHLLSPTPLFQNGQTIVMAIIPDQRSPRECWAAGWTHNYSLPRVLTSDASGHLFQSPLPAIEAWGKPLAALARVELKDGVVTPLEGVSGATLRLQLTIRRGNSQSVSLLLRRSQDGRERTELRYQWEIGRLVLDRTESSLDPRVRRDTQETTYFPPVEDALSLDVFLDHSVLEVFLDGRAAFATRLYPTLSGSDGVALRSWGSGAIAEGVVAASIGKPSRGSIP